MNTFRRILSQRDFWPLFGAQALGAFNDNFFRQALIAYLAFSATGLSQSEKTILASLATGLLMLPFFLFSSLAGELADHCRKSTLVKITKAAEVGAMTLAAFFFATGHIYALLIILFFMGLQSTFFGPLKYGLLPEILEEKDLLGGNGLVEGATFIAIVLGTQAGSWLVTRPAGTSLYMPVGLTVVALAGLSFALKQPHSRPGRPEVAVQARTWRSTYEIIASVKSRPDIWMAILGISWFWGMGAVFMTQIPILCREVIGGTPEVSTFLLTMFALGVAIGSVSAQGLLKGRVSAALVPASAALLTVFMADLSWNLWRLPPAAPDTVDLTTFLSSRDHLRLGFSCLVVSVLGGLFVVPLNAMIQYLSEAGERARVVAANNIINSLFICAGSLLVMLLTYLGASLPEVFAFVAASALVVTAASLSFLSAEALGQFLRLGFRLIYRPRLAGLEHLAGPGGPALVVANHVSRLDAAFLAAFLPRRLTFALDGRADIPRILAKLLNPLPFDPGQPQSVRAVLEALAAGGTVVIFPEGRPTATGGLMKVTEAAGLIAAQAQAPLVPVILDGLQYTRWGLWRSLMRHRPARPKVSLTVLPPRPLKPGEGRRERRGAAAETLLTLLIQSRFATEDLNRNLWTALGDAARLYGPDRPILEDTERRPLSYRSLRRRARVLGRRLAAQTLPGEAVGLLLPNSSIAVTALFGLWAGGRTALPLNHTQGPAALTEALATARVKTIVTSRRFLEAVNLTEAAARLPARLWFLEDLALGLRDKLAALTWRGRPAPPDSPAVMVFTSGSEGRPKGVALSHANMLADILAARCHIEVNEDDLLFNAMPLFHAFGLNIGALLPLMLGMRSFNYLSPLHANLIPELIYDLRATVIITSDTFAASWGRHAHPYDFKTVRFFLVGAEKVKERTRDLYAQKFGLRIYEGYGVTEGAPVLAVSTPMRCRAGSVGTLLPGLEARLEPMEGLESGGRLLARGPNIMLGYLDPARPGVFTPPPDGWYDTGDIVDLDPEGFIWIKGRARRFAKIAGEMISLASVEAVAAALWPERPLAVVALADDRKGEKLVLVTEEAEPDLEGLRRALKGAGFAEIACPRESHRLAPLPLTPLGKPNLPEIQLLVQAAGESRPAT
ncbi:MAG: MFS transporter [Candidatus Adiutrix sp.]|jgi:acyl-[acyl-carrier-protein]-phospholipid O-acyltransferase/long-chain-fatty-acid--[acyl-carrier-protein] ligase|nr:MFS transporter [Candidatus Adiutrix sp.]